MLHTKHNAIRSKRNRLWPPIELSIERNQDRIAWAGTLTTNPKWGT